jgi:hypothetical protein
VRFSSVQMRQGWAQSRCRCGRGGPSRGADVCVCVWGGGGGGCTTMNHPINGWRILFSWNSVWSWPHHSHAGTAPCSVAWSASSGNSNRACREADNERNHKQPGRKPTGPACRAALRITHGRTHGPHACDNHHEEGKHYPRACSGYVCSAAQRASTIAAAAHARALFPQTDARAGGRHAIAIGGCAPAGRHG